MNQVYRIPVMELIHRDKFSDKEWSKLENCVRTVRNYDSARRNYEGATIAAGRALIQIRDEKLYRGYPTLKSFCQSVFGWSDRRTQQLIKSSKVVSALPEKSEQIVRNEGQARELARVPEHKRSETLKLAERVYSKDGKITAKGIKAAGQKVVGPVDKIGFPIPSGDAQYYWERKQEVQDILTSISSLRSAIERISRTDPLFAYVRLGNVEGELDSAYNQMKGALPAYVCVTCNGIKPKNCGSCHGTGLLSQFAWDHGTSIELKKKREHRT